MSLLLKALISAVVVYGATRVFPSKPMSHMDSLIVSLVSAGVLLGLHLFIFSPKPRRCHALERFAADMTADEAGLVFGCITKPPGDVKVQDIYYSGDTLSLTTPDKKFIGKASSADNATVSSDPQQSLSSFRIELYNTADLKLQSQCKALSAGVTTADQVSLMTIPINGIVVFKHTVNGQDRYLSVKAGQLMANQQPEIGTTNHYFKLVDPNNITDTTSILRQGATIAIMYAGDSNTEKAFVQIGTGGNLRTGATITDATKFQISPCITACSGPNWRYGNSLGQPSVQSVPVPANSPPAVASIVTAAPAPSLPARISPAAAPAATPIMASAAAFVTATPVSASVTTPVLTPSTTVTATTPVVYTYTGNNGSVNGNTYCKGTWGSTDGKDKNMTCQGGITKADPRGATYVGKTVACGDTMAQVAGGAGSWAYACSPPAPAAATALAPAAATALTPVPAIAPPAATTPLVYTYTGNNGSVNGNTYCKGTWGSTDGKDKNMICQGGITKADPRGATYVGKTVACGDVMGQVSGGTGHWAYACSPPAPVVATTPLVYSYGGNNGSVNGNTYCKGTWGSTDGKDKNMICKGGITKADPRGAAYVGKTVACGDVMGMVAGGSGHWAYACS